MMKHKQTQKQPQHAKPYYIPPKVTSYETSHLLRQLGPARAISNGRSMQDDLLGLGLDH